MPSTSAAIFKYINVIRDPLKQALSAFDYIRYNYLNRPHSHARTRLSASLVNITMEQCVQSGDPARCLSFTYGAMQIIPFFCGQSLICLDTRTQAALHKAVSLAKANIERFYTWVGILEYFESSLELLESLLPAIFVGITELYRTKPKTDRKNVLPADYRHPISNKTRAILVALLEAEYELYEFARKRFIDDYRRVFRRSPLRSRDFQ